MGWGHIYRDLNYNYNIMVCELNDGGDIITIYFFCLSQMIKRRMGEGGEDEEEEENQEGEQERKR